jgi:hypothetical protein
MWDLIDEQIGGHQGLQKGETLEQYSQLIALGLSATKRVGVRLVYRRPGVSAGPLLCAEYSAYL